MHEATKTFETRTHSQLGRGLTLFVTNGGNCTHTRGTSYVSSCYNSLNQDLTNQIQNLKLNPGYLYEILVVKRIGSEPGRGFLSIPAHFLWQSRSHEDHLRPDAIIPMATLRSV